MHIYLPQGGAVRRASYAESLRARLGRPRVARPNYGRTHIAMAVEALSQQVAMEWRITNNLGFAS